MKTFTSILTLAALVLALAPTARAADFYANALVSSSPTDLYTPQNAVGAPDQMYADFRDEDAYLKLDMGEGEEGRDGLMLNFVLLNFGASTRVTFYSADDTMIGTDYTQFSSGTSTWTAVLQSSESYRYVKIESTEPEQWRLDAVQATAMNTPVEEPPVTEEPTPEPTEPDEINSGDLIKSADSSAVYEVGDDGKRHPFPNEVTFFSWDYSFDDVVTVDAQTLASYLIGGSVTIKPGSYLVKIQSVPKVYTVAPNHTLRWITSEELAIDLYGADWAKQVVDVSDALWPRYTEGAPIESAADLEGWETETRPY